MSNFIINGIEVSEEQYKRIKNMRQIPDEEIDYSDIPPTSDEQLARMKANRLRKKNLKMAG